MAAKVKRRFATQQQPAGADSKRCYVHCDATVVAEETRSRGNRDRGECNGVCMVVRQDPYAVFGIWNTWWTTPS